MQTIPVDFEVYKQLTLRRATEEVTYNDVLRELLELDPTQQFDPAKPEIGEKGDIASPDDWVVKRVRFPVGTEFRANYKGRIITAQVERGALVVNGQSYSSPSAAAVAITGISTNGWIFWESKFPGKSTWQQIGNLRW